MRSVYVHIPFCKSICSYCDFCKFLHKEEWANLYLDALSKEIDEYYEGDTVKTIYIGGGTPSCLSIENIHRLFSILKKLKLSTSYEITFECNIDDISHDLLETLALYGVNRLSIGIESFNEKNLKFMNRHYNKKEIIEKIKLCRIHDFDNINVDLIYALPNETIDDLKKDLDFIKSLDITHISTYSLMIEEHTVLNNKKTKNIDENLDREMYELINNELKEYDHYEISNFAKEKKYRSIHNYSYWENKNYYGFGLSSSGYLNNIRYTRTRSLTKYFNHDYMKDNGIEFLNTKDKIYYEIILRLRTKEGINLKDFKNTYHNDLEKYYDYKDLLERNLLVLKDNHLSIPTNLWYISNSVIVELLEGEK